MQTIITVVLIVVAALTLRVYLRRRKRQGKAESSVPDTPEEVTFKLKGSSRGIDSRGGVVCGQDIPNLCGMRNQQRSAKLQLCQ